MKKIWEKLTFRRWELIVNDPNLPKESFNDNAQLKDAFAKALDIKDAMMRFTPQDLVHAGVEKFEGSIVSELRDRSEFPKDRLLEIPAQSWGQLGISVLYMHGLGYAAAELKVVGYPANELTEAGYAVQDLKNASCSNADLATLGYN